jgi:AraC-like DNA-binding protein
MPFLRYKPQAPLNEFVDVLWLSEAYSVAHQKERLLPDSTVELVVNLKEDRIRVYDSRNCEHGHTIPGCVVSGPRSEFFVVDTETQAETMGVHFRPGGAFPFFKMPASELKDQSVALEFLWGSGSRLLRERLLEAQTPEAKFSVLERCLLEQLTNAEKRHPAVSFAMNRLLSGHACPVSRIVEEVGLSSRHFIQLFRDQVGLTPKLFSRVGRFQKIVQIVHGKQSVDWAELALACGYYDQAHFIHDFQSFAGIKPTDYLRQRTEHVNHVPLLD